MVLLFSSGCASDDAAARRQLEDRVRVASTQSIDQKVLAMRPFYGRWTVDLDATLAQNPSMPEPERERVRQDLTQFPFELEITSSDYISLSRAKTNADRYEVESVDGEVVTIALTATDGRDTRAGRRAVLRLQDGKLLIGRAGGLVIVMSRTPADR